MKTKTYKRILISGLFTCSVFSAQATTGVFGSYVGVNPNDSGNSWYGAQQWGAVTLQDFQGANLGTYNLGGSDTLEFSAYQVQSFKSDGGDVTGIEMQYRVYEQATIPGSFTTVVGSFLANAPFSSAAGNEAAGSGDQNWGVNPTGELGNLLSGTEANKTYNVEIFFRAITNEGDRYSNNGGNNFIATFSTVPEPSTYAAMAGIAVMAIAILRRRK